MSESRLTPSGFEELVAILFCEELHQAPARATAVACPFCRDDAHRLMRDHGGAIAKLAYGARGVQYAPMTLVDGTPLSGRGSIPDQIVEAHARGASPPREPNDKLVSELYENANAHRDSGAGPYHGWPGLLRKAADRINALRGAAQGIGEGPPSVLRDALEDAEELLALIDRGVTPPTNVWEDHMTRIRAALRGRAVEGGSPDPESKQVARELRSMADTSRKVAGAYEVPDTWSDTLDRAAELLERGPQ